MAPANFATRRWNDGYLLLLAAILAGYALLGKGFAYLGVPPIYVGEMAGVAGVVLLLRSGRYLALLTTVPAMLLAATMVWVRYYARSPICGCTASMHCATALW